LITIRLGLTGAGGSGGISRNTRGSGVGARGGCWRMMRGGAGPVTMFASS